jgi:spermidine/putrescine transport system ATP-binding protein
VNQPAIVIDNVTKTFADVQAVKGITLTIGEGEFFSLLGPSGCGKTTLLRMIAGFEHQTSGQVLIRGNDMTGVPPHKRPVNMVFQSYALFPHMSVFENVAFGLKIKKSCPSAEIAQRVEEALTLVRLPHLAHRYPRELSGGQQQRVAFARAIVNKPFVLLLDEPLSALDPRIREEMQTELARFKRELGITFVMVTHDQSEAFALSDKVAVFNAGQLEQIGTPQDIYERPRSAFVADFIGHTNVLQAKVVEQQGQLTVVALPGDTRIFGTLADGASVEKDDDVTVWIRTDAIDVILSTDPEPAVSSKDFNVLSGTIIHRSYQGNTSDFIIKTGELTVTASIETARALQVSGAEVTLTMLPQRTHILK